MTKKPTVLVVEDKKYIQKLFEIEIGEIVDLLQAYTLEEARALLDKNSPISVIVMDGSLPDGNSYTLVTELRNEGFEKKILAFSSGEGMNEELMEAGCSSAISFKPDGPKAVLRELGMK